MLESDLLPNVQGYIDGAWLAADDGSTRDVHNPATGETIAAIPNMGGAETDRAIEAGVKALDRPAGIEDRRKWLKEIADALLDNKREFGRVLTMEHGKPWSEAEGEVAYAAGFFRYCSEHMDHFESRTLEETPKDHRWTVHQRPAGVVGLITPWNFPIGMIAKKLSAAIAADCSSVIKPSGETPLSMIALFTLLDREVGLPAGKANLVMGSAGAIGDALCEHPDVHVISFTGSTEVGKMLIDKTKDQVKRLTLELGGNAPYIVFADADLDKAADHLIVNKFRGSGQTCVCANRILVQADVVDAFAAKVAERVERMTVGDGMDEGTDIGPLINKAGYDKVRHHLQDALDKGASKVAGGDAPPIDTDWGGFFPPTVIKGVDRSMECCIDETFGPLVPIMAFRDEDDAVEKGNDTEYGLAAYVFTTDRSRAEGLIRRLHFGHVGFNTGTGPTPEAPFGGMKQSGYGREGGLEGLMEFVEPQTVPEPL